ncbi:hypothetical protein [Nonomuraea jiangxiensis]|uniref:Uncharacterized protein n=1 Tax=Nonomuraea jiangxiensis TaxID=633440 RepID=A0A1G8M7P7_9ACTN|nr:hypothetical protein [Nonomuraea jiangxiensis]SDI63857.1 hypothetical protein SAMN05421869_106327 [Nonomuraea jiangxiensis]
MLFLLSSVMVGVLVGCLTHLLLPGRQSIGWVATIGAGAAVAGLAYVMDFANNAWLVLGLEFVLAAACVCVVSIVKER